MTTMTRNDLLKLSDHALRALSDDEFWGAIEPQGICPQCDDRRLVREAWRRREETLPEREINESDREEIRALRKQMTLAGITTPEFASKRSRSRSSLSSSKVPATPPICARHSLKLLRCSRMLLRTESLSRQTISTTQHTEAPRSMAALWSRAAPCRGRQGTPRMTDDEALSDAFFLQRYGECTLTVEEADGQFLVCCPGQINAITRFERIEEAFEWIRALHQAAAQERRVPMAWHGPHDLLKLSDQASDDDDDEIAF
jgi:hypothetical protein